MTISILTDNHSGNHTAAEHGLSYLIEHDGKKILFDTGQSQMFLMNAGLMGIDPENADIIILSHGHYDHGDGLQYLKGGTLLCHPECFIKRYDKNNDKYIGLKNSKDEIAGKFNLITSKSPYEISDRIIFLGEIPRITCFESKTTPFVFEDGTSDFVRDDSAIALILQEGLFVVTGCGHSGIINTLEYAKKITTRKRVCGIMGGFHMKEFNIQTQNTIQYLQDNKVNHVYPSHCTALPALSAFYINFKIKQVKTGDVYIF